MRGQRSTFLGPMVLDLGGQWSGANRLGGQSSIYRHYSYKTDYVLIMQIDPVLYSGFRDRMS